MQNSFNDNKKVVKDYLDKYFYKGLSLSTTSQTTFNRLSFTQKRESLVDVILKYGENNIYKISEMISPQSFNQKPNACSFKLGYIENNTLYRGHLFNENFQTSHYMIVYPNISIPLNVSLQEYVSSGKISTRDFTTSEILLISKKKLLNYVTNELKINDNFLFDINNNSIKKILYEIKPKEAYLKAYIQGDAIYFNLVISKNKLYDLACGNWLISDNKRSNNIVIKKSLKKSLIKNNDNSK